MKDLEQNYKSIDRMSTSNKINNELNNNIAKKVIIILKIQILKLMNYLIKKQLKEIKDLFINIIYH